MTDQTKLGSFIEASLNTGSGFIISLLFWTYFIVPVYHLPVTQAQNIVITLWFTVVSVVRSYGWRRFFSNGIHKKLHKLFAKGV